jgi:hypothetical protein
MQNEKHSNNRCIKERVEARGKKMFLSVKRKVGRQHQRKQQQLGPHGDINSASSEEKNIILNEGIAFDCKFDAIGSRKHTYLICILYFSDRLTQHTRTMAATANVRSLNKAVLQRYLDLPQPDNKVMATYIWIDGTGENVRGIVIT